MTAPNYRTAPLKAISREMIFEVCRRLVAFGPLRDYAYVGLGGVEFVDFLAAYQTLGVRTMVSVESTEYVERLEFNRPYDQIRLLSGHTNDQLPQIAELKEQPSVVWLDYVSSFDQEAIQDLRYLGHHLKPGSALFVTFNAHYDERNWSVARVAENFGDYHDDAVTVRDLVAHGLGDYQLLASEQVLARAFAGRADAVDATRVLDLRYKDSSRMQVAGWIIADSQEDVDTKCRLDELDFTVAARDGRSLQLAVPKLTLREWAELERQLPQSAASTLTPPHRWVTPATMKQFVEVHRYARSASSA